MKRNYLLDFFRGLLIIVMIIDHLPGKLQTYTFQSFGFFSAAEGFIFISGYVIGLVYTKNLNNVMVVTSKALKRTINLYIHHIGTFISVLAVLIILPFIISSDSLNMFIANFEKDLYATPVKTIVSFLLLFNQPQLFNILPLYILLLLSTPFLVKLFQVRKMKIALLLSFTAWLAVNIMGRFSFLSFHLSYRNTEGFNFFAWQFLFVIGLCLGTNKRHNFFSLGYTKTRIYISAFIVMMFFGLRLINHNHEFLHSLFHLRSDLSPLRLLNFLVFVYLISAVTRNIKVKKTNPVAIVGKSSLEVFSLHIVILYLILPFRYAIESLNIIFQLPIYATVILICCIPAFIRHRKALFPGSFKILNLPIRAYDGINNLLYKIISYPFSGYNI